MTVSGLVLRMATRALGIPTILLVNDEDDRKRPKPHAEEERTVVDHQLGRAPALVTEMDEVEVAEDAVERKWNRQAEEVGPEFRCRLRTDCVEHVGNQR